jgi:dihydroneopterin aldolase
MMTDNVPLDGLVPRHLEVRSAKIVLESLSVMADIGFHDFEVGTPQRLLITVELWMDDVEPPLGDDPAGAWDYDYLRKEVVRIAGTRRWNLQETLARAVYDRIAALKGIRALRVATAKPDIYEDAEKVGVEIASFPGGGPA